MAAAPAVQDRDLTSRFDAASPELPARLQSFLQARWGKPVVVETLRRFPAGMSWITFGFTARVGMGPGDTEPRELILRIGDPCGLLAPYRAEPEFVVLRTLAGQDGLPVPEAVAFSDDAEVLGAPFLVTQRVLGDTPMPWKGAGLAPEEAATRSLGRDFADGLGAIHAFDWQRSPLAALFPNVPLADVAANQVGVWARHADMASGAGPAQMHYAMRWLEAHAPVADRASLVHGDYRVGNFLQQEGRITAILDWELVHVGDPHEDLAWAGLRAFSAGTARIGGLFERDAFDERYCQRTGFKIRPDVVRYYEVLVQFKMAAMLIGAVRQTESGRARDVRMAAMGFQLAPTLLELNRLIAEAS